MKYKEKSEAKIRSMNVGAQDEFKSRHKEEISNLYMLKTAEHMTCSVI